MKVELSMIVDIGDGSGRMTGSHLIVGEMLDTYVIVTDRGMTREDFPKLGKNITASKRSELLLEKLDINNGFLDKHLEEAIQLSEHGLSPFEDPELGEFGSACTRAIVEGFLGEKGRGLYVLSVLVCAIKSIIPEQDIRLHKVRWDEGIDMRSIDRNCVTKWFNSRDLGVKLNTDGAFMTRTLAENYPYVPIYQADLKGPKEEWLELIDLIQSEKVDPSSALRALLYGAYLRQLDFQDLVIETKSKLGRHYTAQSALKLVTDHIDGRKNGGSRLLEIAVHSLFQCVLESKSNNIPSYMIGNLAPIKPMRSPDKKAGDIGDIQLRNSNFIDRKGHRFLRYSVDCKYEIHEVGDEILRSIVHITDPNTPQQYLERLDFVGLKKPPKLSSNPRYSSAVMEIENMGIKVSFRSLEEIFNQFNSDEKLSKKWVDRYLSMIARENTGYGEVTEITTDWLNSLSALL